MAKRERIPVEDGDRHRAMARARSVIGEDLGFQRRMWRAERIAWASMAAVLAAAVAGVFGNGLWSRAEVVSDSGALRVAHERVLRWGATYEFDVAGGAQGLRLDADLTAALRVLESAPGDAAAPLRVTPRVRFALVSGVLRDGTGAQVPIRLAVLP